MNRVSDFFHALIAGVGVLLAMQAPFTAYLLQLGAPARAIDLGFGALGLTMATASKWTDSWNNAKTTGAGSVAAMQAQLAAHVGAPPPLP
jgi:hypothetical protein